MTKKLREKTRNQKPSQHKKLFECSNSTCPNRSHYTPACPNLAGKKTNTSSAVSTQPALSINVNRAASVEQGEGSGKIGGNVGEAFDRFAMMVEETEESFPTVLPDGTQEWKNRAGERHRSGDRPAIIRDGAQMWYRNGKLHRDGDQPARICSDGSQEWWEWWQNGKPHRSGDQPAIIYSDGTQMWYRNGERHRSGDRPAIIRDGAQMWYRNGKLHRDGDQPAIIRANGTKEWYQNGEEHRSGDQPARIYSDGTQERWEWWQNGKLHRSGDQPAIVHPDGIQEWYQNGERHRVSGPAVIYPDGAKEWWWEGEEVKHPDVCEQAFAPAQTEEEKNNLILLCLHDDPAVASVAAHNPDCPEEGQTMYLLRH